MRGGIVNKNRTNTMIFNVTTFRATKCYCLSFTFSSKRLNTNLILLFHYTAISQLSHSKFGQLVNVIVRRKLLIFSSALCLLRVAVVNKYSYRLCTTYHHVPRKNPTDRLSSSPCRPSRPVFFACSAGRCLSCPGF